MNAKYIGIVLLALCLPGAGLLTVGVVTWRYVARKRRERERDRTFILLRRAAPLVYVEDEARA